MAGPSTHPDLAEAVARHQAGDLSQATTLYRQILAAQPGNADALHLLGLLEHQQGRSEAGIELIEQALSHRPDSPLFLGNLAGILIALGKALADSGDSQGARHHLDRALELAPEDARAHGHLADLLANEGRLDEAARHYKTVLRIDPKSGSAHCGLGNVLREQGHLDKALEHCQRGLALHPRYAIGYTDLGRCLQELRRDDDALAAYRQALAIDSRLYSVVAKKLAKASAGRVWLHPSQLRKALLE